MTTYVDAEDMFDRLGGNVLASQKPGIEAALTAACAAIDVHCGQTFTKSATAVTRTYRPLDERCAYVGPFWTLDELEIKTDTGDDGTFATTWTSADYELEHFGGSWGESIGAPYDTILAVGGLTFPTRGRRSRTLQVTAKPGWAAVPANVIEATKAVAADLWRRKDAPFGATTGGAHEFGALRLTKSALDQAEPLLERFVRVDITVGIA